AGYGEELVPLLLNAKADVNAKDTDGYTALMLASRAGRREEVRLLDGTRAEEGERAAHGGTALMKASRRGQREVVRLLLDAKDGVSAKTAAGVQTWVLAT